MKWFDMPHCIAARNIELLFKLKANLHRIRFSFSIKNYVLSRPHFYKSISALSPLLHIEKILLKNFGHERSALLQNRTQTVQKQIRKLFV